MHGADAGVGGPLVLVGGPVHHVEDGAAGQQVVALVQHGDPHAAGAGDAAVVGLLHAGQDAQQRGLAGAVGADDADALAVVEPEGDLVEEGARAQRERDAIRAEKVCHVL